MEIQFIHVLAFGIACCLDDSLWKCFVQLLKGSTVIFMDITSRLENCFYFLYMFKKFVTSNDGKVRHGHLHTRPDKVPPQAKYLPNQPKYELEISHR